MRRGELFILAAPAGAGAAALVEAALARAAPGREAPWRPVLHTTRPRREGEVDGRDYHFVDRARFRRMIDGDRFLEWTEVGGRLYGTARDQVDTRLERGVSVLLEVDPAAAERLRAACPGARTLAILPPAPGAPPERLALRTPSDAVSSSEVTLYDPFDCVIINDDLGRAGAVVASLILAG